MSITAQLIAASAQRQIGYVIAGIVLLAMVIYWIFNWLDGRHETGAEVELAANRNINMTDEEMETKRLDLSLTGGLLTLTVIAIALPLYWLGEPGRHEGLIEFTDDQFVRQGEELFAENCAQCHGSANGEGGVAADFAIVDGNGVYVDQVQWGAPSLAAVLDRFSYDEVKYILNYGRSNSPMPAWGAPGGGPMTDQQIDKVIAYLAHEQQSSEDIAKGVLDGLDGAALAKAQADNPDMYARQLELADMVAVASDNLSRLDADSADAAALQAEIDTMLEEHGSIIDELAALGADIRTAADSDQIVMGELLFNNPASAGAYGCARCHSAGWSYSANDFPTNPLIPPIVNGSGGFAPGLVGVSDQFEDAADQASFITQGSKNGQAYGAFGQGDGGGQMPGFGACWAEDNAILPRIQSDRIEGHCEGRSGILTTEQIEAIVAYERSLD